MMLRIHILHSYADSTTYSCTSSYPAACGVAVHLCPVMRAEGHDSKHAKPFTPQEVCKR